MLKVIVRRVKVEANWRKIELAEINSNNKAEGVTADLGSTGTTNAATVVTTGSAPLYKSIYSRMDDDMLCGFMKRAVKILHFTWSTAAATNTTSTYYLFELWKANATTVLEKMKHFNYISGDLKVKAVVNGQGFNYGQMVIGFEPVIYPYLQQAASPGTFSVAKFPRSWQLPHLEIYPNVIEEREITLHTWGPSGAWGKDIPSDIRMTINVVNPIVSCTANAPTNVTICFYMWFENHHMVAPTFATTLSENKPLSINDKSNFSVSQFMSKLAGDTLQGFVAPIKDATSGAAELLSQFGFAKPSIPEDQSYIVGRTHNKLTQVDGRNNEFKMANFQNNEIPISHDCAGIGMNGDMVIPHLTSKKGYYYRFPYSTTHTSGQNIKNIPVNVLGNYSLGVVAAGRNHELTPLSFISELFQYYTGDLILTFQAVAGNLQRGQLHFIFTPNGVPLTYDEAIQSAPGVLLTVNGTTEVELHCPYFKPSPAQLTTRIIDVDSIAFNSVSDHGFVGVYAVNPLTSPGSTSDVFINVFIRAADNYRLYRPIFKNQTYSVVGVTGPLALAMSEEEEVEVETFSEETRMFGESFLTVKQLINKSVLGAAYSAPLSTARETLNTNGYDWFLPVGWTGGAVPRYYHDTFINCLAIAYVGRTGGSRLSWTVTNIDKNEFISASINYQTTPTGITPMSQQTTDPLLVGLTLETDTTAHEELANSGYVALQQPSISQTIDIVYPGIYPWYYIPNGYRLNISQALDTQFTYRNSNIGGCASLLFAGGADDTAFHFWRGCPMVVTTVA